MRLHRPAFALSLACLTPLTGAAPAATSIAEPFPAAVVSRLADSLGAVASGSDGPGCAVAVRRRSAQWRGGFGLAQIEHGVPIGADTAFHAASVAKQFTAFSILLLQAEGKLSLDDDIRRHLPEMHDFGTPITIAQLMHHTSGLREQGALLSLSGWRADDVATQQDMLRVLFRQRQLNFKPGTEVVYTNSAYTLMAEIVRRASGQSLRAFAEQRLFQPLGMRSTRFVDDHNEVIPRAADGYRAKSGGDWSRAEPAFDHHGSTNLSTTPEDLLRWLRNLQDGAVGGPAVLAAMRRSGELNDGRVIGYGGGLLTGRHRGLATLSHDGVDHGFRSDVLLLPARDVAVAVTCNGASFDAEKLSRQLADVVLEAPVVAGGDARREAGRGVLGASLAGVYWSPRTDEVMRLELNDGALRRRGDARPVVPDADGMFRVGESIERWRFGNSTAPEVAVAAQVTLDVFDQWPVPRRFMRVEEAMPDDAALKRLEGRYRSEELDVVHELELAGGRLQLRYGRQVTVALEPVGGDRFVGSVGTVTFTRDAAGEVDGLTISNRRMRRLVMTRL